SVSPRERRLGLHALVGQPQERVADLAQLWDDPLGPQAEDDVAQRNALQKILGEEDAVLGAFARIVHAEDPAPLGRIEVRRAPPPGESVRQGRGGATVLGVGVGSRGSGVGGPALPPPASAAARAGGQHPWIVSANVWTLRRRRGWVNEERGAP